MYAPEDEEAVFLLVAGPGFMFMPTASGLRDSKRNTTADDLVNFFRIQFFLFRFLVIPNRYLPLAVDFVFGLHLFMRTKKPRWQYVVFRSFA